MGYAVAYPLGVVGAILSLLALKYKMCIRDSSPISVAIFLFSTLAFASYLLPVAGLEASQ